MEANTSNVLAVLAVLAAMLPLLPTLALLLRGRNGNNVWIGTSAIGISFLISVYLFFSVWNNGVVHVSVPWFNIGAYSFAAGILLNNLSVLMLLLVSFIAFVVHIYSAGYMYGDPGIQRYWGHLGLFCFSMMALVIADNLLLVYAFWEMVGFSSYLLIGYWFTKDAASAAAKKAFIINRIGDLGFLLGILILLTQFQTLDIQTLFADGGLIEKSVVQNGFWENGNLAIPAAWLTVAGLAFVAGAFSKSAQFPFHTWLPDAMEGPTSVSALIHAATMVAAGVFLLARVYPVLDETTLLIITIVGVFTSLAAAAIATVQYDLKKILAFSTISQLGFMMLAMGIGAYNTSIFHLATHAFFKCLLFLVAGVIIHQLKHAAHTSNPGLDFQDIRNMGGLRKRMPLTFIIALIAAAALIGLPLTSGYLSKDAILIRVFEWAEGRSTYLNIIPYTAIAASWLTAFYISRLIVKVFFGRNETLDMAQEKSNITDAHGGMKWSLIVLSVFCVFAVFSFNPFLFEDAWLMQGFIVPDNLQRINIYHTIIPAAVNVASVLIIYFVWKFYRKPDFSVLSPDSGFHRFILNQGYINQGYQRLFVMPVMLASRISSFTDRYILDGFVNLMGRVGIWSGGLAASLDKHVVDGFINFLAYLAGYIGNAFRSVQNGKVQHYLLLTLVAVGAIFILMYFSNAI